MRDTEKDGQSKWAELSTERRSRFIKTICIVLAAVFVVGIAFAVWSLMRYYDASENTEAEVNVLRSERPISTPRPSPSLTQTTQPVHTSEAEQTLPPVMPEPTERIYEVSEHFAALYERNNDLAGWITIDGTHVDYPVMLSPLDGEYYMRHNFEGKRDSHGLPFLDNRCEIAPKSQIQIIYGHNINTGIMFHDLLLYQDEEFWKEHQYITYDTLYDEGVYQIVAAFVFETWRLKPESFQFNRYTEFYAGIATEKRFGNYKENIEKLALYDTGLDFGLDDQLLILATCEYSARNGRFVLLAKLVQ